MQQSRLSGHNFVCVNLFYRFGGGEFPPMIFFKVFLHSEGKGVKYLSGKRIIKPATGVSRLLITKKQHLKVNPTKVKVCSKFVYKCFHASFQAV